MCVCVRERERERERERDGERACVTERERACVKRVCVFCGLVSFHACVILRHVTGSHVLQSCSWSRDSGLGSGSATRRAPAAPRHSSTGPRRRSSLWICRSVPPRALSACVDAEHVLPTRVCVCVCVCVRACTCVLYVSVCCMCVMSVVSVIHGVLCFNVVLCVCCVKCVLCVVCVVFVCGVCA